MNAVDSKAPQTSGPVRGLLRTSLVFSLGAVAGKAFGIVLLPILTRLLSPDDLGRVDIATTFATAMTVLACFQLDVAMTRIYFDLPVGAERRRLLGTFLILLAATTAPVVVAVIVLRDGFSSVLFGNPAFDPLIVGAAFLIVGSVYRTSVLAISRTTGRASDYARLSGGSLILSGVLTVVLLVAWQATSVAVVIAYAVAFAVTAVIGLVILRSEVTPSLSRATTSTLIQFGFPLLPAALAAIVADLVNRTVLLQTTGAADVAYLGVALRFASISGLAVAAFQLAWQPRAYAIFGTAAGRRQIASEGTAILVLLSALSVAIGAVTPEGLHLLAGQPYEVAGPAASLALVAVLASGGFLVASMPSLLARDARSVGIAMGLGVIVGVGLNLLAAPRFGSAGTAAAMATGQAAAFGAIVALGRAGVRLPVPWLRVGLTMGAASVLTVLFTTLSWPLVVRLALVVVFLLAVASVNRPRILLARARDMFAEWGRAPDTTTLPPDQPSADSPDADGAGDERAER